jgi:2,3-dimethylmalate lyase
VYDALGARIVEEAGFAAVYMTGFGTAASMLGRPDIGLVTMSEMVDNASRIVRATSLPVIADADTGYGNPINVIRTVQEYEHAGVAGIHIEDQVSPKRCGHMAGKQVIPAADMVAKVRAAVEARRCEDFVLIARTDAVAVEGIRGAIERAKRYRDAGADVLFVEAPTSEAQIETIARSVPGPKLINMFEGGKTPLVPLARLQALGYRVVIVPSDLQRAAIRAMQEVLAVMRRDGNSRALAGRMATFDEREAVVRTREYLELDRRYGADER